jgi:prevent-host-death family protein
MKMGLREANQKFSRAIREVRAGRPVVLTDRGVPIAVIQPIKTPSSEQAVLDQLRKSGTLRPAKVARPLVSFQPVRLSGRSIVETLQAERDEQ